MKTDSNKNVPSTPTWIWYPGDFEVWLGNRFNNRRTERGAMFPPFWKQDSHWPTVEFTQPVLLEKAERIHFATEGHFNFSIDGKLQPPDCLTIPAGRHRLSFKVWNQASPPALMVWGETIHSDSTWLVTYEDKIWIDEYGTPHGSGVYVPVGSWCFNDPQVPPSHFRLERTEQDPVSQEAVGRHATLYDFGKELFGYLKLGGLKGTARVYYGESREEALDKEHCETLDVLCNDKSEEHQHFTEAASKAFRYVYIEKEAGADYDTVLMDYEYLPQPRTATFHCSDDELNRIWQVSAYTLDLTTREFFMDGIKRDRWTWSGDAIQSYQMNYYLHFDSDCVKRTIRQLRGKDPVTAHVNTIMDYTFYWFKSVADYYEYTGDKAFVCELYPKMVTLMDYVLSRTNEDGMAEGQPDDWIFVDWVDFPMHKRGTLSFEQILFCKSLEVMAYCAGLADDTQRQARYTHLQSQLQQHLKEVFWDEKRHAYVHAVEDGQLNPQVTKFPNMMAMLYNYATQQEKQELLEHVMLNPEVPAITTPYMRYYELEALCQMGLQQQVTREMKNYWGGMLRCGATTFWEKYNPAEQGREHLAMYGRPYGKSLCHAWGASPLYLLGRYYLGVAPARPGYEEFSIRPSLGGLEWIEGTVPTPHGEISVYMDAHTLRVRATEGRGYVYFRSAIPPVATHGQPEPTDAPDAFRLWIDTIDEVTVSLSHSTSSSS